MKRERGYASGVAATGAQRADGQQTRARWKWGLLAAALLFVGAGVVYLVALRPAGRTSVVAVPGSPLVTDPQAPELLRADATTAREGHSAPHVASATAAPTDAALTRPPRTKPPAEDAPKYCLQGVVLLPKRTLEEAWFSVRAWEREQGSRESKVDELGRFSIEFASNAPVRLSLRSTLDVVMEFGTETPLDCRTPGWLQLEVGARIATTRLTVLGSDGQPAPGAWIERPVNLRHGFTSRTPPNSSTISPLHGFVRPLIEVAVPRPTDQDYDIAVGAPGHSTQLVVLTGEEQVVQLLAAKRILVRLHETHGSGSVVVREVTLHTPSDQAVLCASVPLNAFGEAELAVEGEFESKIVATLLVTLPSGRVDTTTGQLVPTKGPHAHRRTQPRRWHGGRRGALRSDTRRRRQDAQPAALKCSLPVVDHRGES